MLLQLSKQNNLLCLKEIIPQKKEANITTSLEFKINTDQKLIGVFATFTFEQAKKVFIKIQVSCHFNIEPDTWTSFLKDSNVVVPKNFISHLTILTIGTSRGILHAKTEGTEFNQFILPTINVNQLVDADAVFDISN